MPFLAGGSLSLLSVNPGLVIWTLVTFLIVLLVLWLFAWKPIIKALDARQEKVETDLRKSQELRERAEKLLQEYEEKIEKARQEALELLEEGRKDAEVQKEKILQAAKDEAKRILERANQEIELAKIKALDEIEDSVVNLTMEVLRRIFQDRLKNEEHRQLVVEELSRLRQAIGKQ